MISWFNKKIGEMTTDFLLYSLYQKNQTPSVKYLTNGAQHVINNIFLGGKIKPHGYLSKDL